MDILLKYAPLIAGTIDGQEVVRTLKEEGVLHRASFLTLIHAYDDESVGSELIKMLLDQVNIQAIATLFEIIIRVYPDLASSIPELSYGERFTLYLGDDIFLRVLVNDGYVTVDFRQMEVS